MQLSHGSKAKQFGKGGVNLQGAEIDRQDKTKRQSRQRKPDPQGRRNRPLYARQRCRRKQNGDIGPQAFARRRLNGARANQRQLMEEALAVAAKIASFSTPAVMMAKEAVNRAYETKYGLDYRMLGKLAVTQRNHALLNENACEKLRVPITIDDYMNSRIIADPIVMIINPEMPYKTLKELMEDAKANPNKLIFSSSGLYGALHLPTALLTKAAGL